MSKQMEEDKQAMVAYYAQRAATYDEIYQRPARQPDQATLFAHVQQLARGQRVLELACGTGYWSRILAETASSVHGVDINPAMLACAQARGLDAQRVSFALANLFELPEDLAQGGYTMCFAGFWWSHVKRAEQDAFLQQLRRLLGPDCVLVLVDNSYIEGDSTPISRTDADGNTWSFRPQQDGSRVEIVKNFPSDSALKKRFAGHAREVRITRLQYFWLLSCRLK